MVRHDLKSMSEDELRSPHEPEAPDPAEYDPAAEYAASTDKFREQMHSSQRLNEYYNQVVAEIRASLERAEAEVGSSA